ncbi:VOC family protein [uncultured Mitsuokella sp.]|uniref:VOC family protein n=1 Tax=uncultured Mitsuokella sp. TaxID=453120 RepID=UPI00266F86A2|nr:VOC family protein [uncultured Mitsuokella sp.]
MKIKSLDHFVLTTKCLEKCLHFYHDLLGMRVEEKAGRYALFFGAAKINIHQKAAEFLPAAEHPQSGSLDFCLVVEDDIEALQQELAGKGAAIELGPVERHGARGRMKSIYLRDPDGNLVELCHYETL